MSRKGTPDPHVDRRHARHGAKGVACALGKIVDLSAGGMCVESARKPDLEVGTATKITLKTTSGPLELPIRVCRVKRKGFLKGWEIGIKFMGLSAAQVERIEAIAKYGFVPDEAAEPEAAPASPASEQLREQVRTAAAAGVRGGGGNGKSNWDGVERRRNREHRDGDGDDAETPGTSIAPPVSAGLMAQIIRDRNFKTLGLDDNANLADLRTAYRRLVRTCHPDVNDTPEAAEKFMELQQAYAAVKRELNDAA